MKTNLGLFLHLYQPPVQKKDVVQKVTVESYLPIIAGLKKNPQARVTMNITGCLVLQWDKYGYQQLIADIAQLVAQGTIELTGSSAYHAFLPKLPVDQVIRQITLNTEILKKYFGKDIVLRGFFPPEMAFVPSLVPVIKDLGFEWIALDERGKHGARVHHRLFEDKHGMKYAFRDRDLSYETVTGEMSTARDLRSFIKRPPACGPDCDGYTIIALDGETFGHHRHGYEKILEDMYVDKQINLMTISGLMQKNYPVSSIKPRKSSWTILDRARSIKQPFLRWADPENEIHTMQWKLTKLACQITHDEKSQKKLDLALFSCQYWWACAKPWWYIEMIEAGAYALLQSILSSHSTAVTKTKAVDLYHDIVATAFDWIRTGKMQRLVDQEHEYLHYNKDAKVNQ